MTETRQGASQATACLPGVARSRFRVSILNLAPLRSRLFPPSSLFFLPSLLGNAWGEIEHMYASVYEAETELDRAASRAAIPTLSLLLRALGLHHPALADATICLRLRSHAELLGAWGTHHMALRQACHRPAASCADAPRRAVGSGGPAHLLVSISRICTGMPILTLNIAFRRT